MTLNQIVKRVQSIALSHDQIGSFFFGDIDDMLSVDVQFPLCFMTVPTSTITGADDVLSCSLLVMDRQIQGGNNDVEVMSDMREVALDLLAQMQYNKFDPLWTVLKSANYEFFNERSEDYLAGVKIDFQIKLPYLSDRCQVPTTFNYGN